MSEDPANKPSGQDANKPVSLFSFPQSQAPAGGNNPFANPQAQGSSGSSLPLGQSLFGSSTLTPSSNPFGQTQPKQSDAFPSQAQKQEAKPSSGSLFSGGNITQPSMFGGGSSIFGGQNQQPFANKDPFKQQESKPLSFPQMGSLTQAQPANLADQTASSQSQQLQGQTQAPALQSQNIFSSSGTSTFLQQDKKQDDKKQPVSNFPAPSLGGAPFSLQSSTQVNQQIQQQNQPSSSLQSSSGLFNQTNIKPTATFPSVQSQPLLQSSLQQQPQKPPAFGSSGLGQQPQPGLLGSMNNQPMKPTGNQMGQMSQSKIPPKGSSQIDTSSVHKINIDLHLPKKISSDMHNLINQFSETYKKQHQQAKQQEELILADDYGLTEQYYTSIQRNSEDYLGAMCSFITKRSGNNQEQQIVQGMIEFWNVFDAVHLSMNKSEVILKLIKAIQFKEDRIKLYSEIQRKIMNDDQFGPELCKLVACGDFSYVYKFIQMSKNYKEQDYLLNSFVEEVANFTKMLSTLYIRQDINYQLLNKSLVNLTQKSQQYLDQLNSLKQTNQLQASLKQMLQLMSGDVAQASKYSEQSYLKEMLLLVLFQPPGQVDVEESFNELAVRVLQSQMALPDFEKAILHYLQFRPLRMLLKLDEMFSEIVSFHLRDIYIKFNLLHENKLTQVVFRNLNEDQAMKYIGFLQSREVDIKTVVPYILALDESDKKYDQLKQTLEYYQVTLKYTYEQIYNLLMSIIEEDGDREQYHDLLYEIQVTQVKLKLQEGQCQSAFASMFQMKRLNFITEFGIQKVDELLDSNTYNDCLQFIEWINEELSQDAHNEIIARSQHFEYLILFAKFKEACYNADTVALAKIIEYFTDKMRIPNRYYKPIIQELYPLLIKTDIIFAPEMLKKIARVVPQIDNEFDTQFLKDLAIVLSSRLISP